MVITSTLINAGQSPRGGWNAKQLQLLGEQWPPTPGWQSRVEGQTIDSRDAERFIDLSGQTVRAPRRKKLKKDMKSELPFPPNVDPNKALPVHSMWVWLNKQSVEDRAMLQEALLYMTRKNNEVIHKNPPPPQP